VKTEMTKVSEITKALVRMIEAAKLDFALDMVKLMERAGYTQQEVAERAGVKPPYVNRVLRGDENLTIATMVKLANAAGARINIHLSASDCAVRWLEVIGTAARTVHQAHVSGDAWGRSGMRNGVTIEKNFRAANDHEAEPVAA